jgi:prepilin-type processing-associated H-X9-DG protein
MSEEGKNVSGSGPGEEEQRFEESVWADVVFKFSDISCFAKWPLLILAVVLWLCSILTWYAGASIWLSGGEIVFFKKFMYLMNIVFVVLAAGLLLCLGIVIASLGIYKFLLKREIYKYRVLTESTGVLLSNSFYFGIALVFVFLTFLSRQGRAYKTITAAINQTECSHNLEKLYEVLERYAEKNHYHYPAPDKWCDLIGVYSDVRKGHFVCPAGEDGRCHYALNPNAEPLSKYENFHNYLESCGYHNGSKPLWLEEPEGKDLHLRYLEHGRYDKEKLSKVVLLFESEPGWNRFGGPELLTFDNHGGRGCNILFSDGNVRFIKPEDANDLKWKPDEDQKE